MLPQVLRREICSLYLLHPENYVKLLQFLFLQALSGEIFASYVLFVVRMVFSVPCVLCGEAVRGEGLQKRSSKCTTLTSIFPAPLLRTTWIRSSSISARGMTR